MDGDARTFAIIGGFLVLVVGGYLAYNYVFKGNIATANALSGATVSQNQLFTGIGVLGNGLGNFLNTQSSS
jgi:hypothetical protein